MKRGAHARVCVALQVLLWPLVCSAQENGGGDALRVETRLVQVDVVVQNDDGPVRGLSAEDFTLFDDGEAVEITLFEIVETPASPRPAPVTPVPAESVESNRLNPTSENPASASILLLDRLNTEAVDQPYANDQAIEFLASLDPRHQVAVYALGARLSLVQDYTNDRTLLMRAVAGVGMGVSSQLEASYGEAATGGFEARPDQVGLDPDLVDAQSAGTGIEERGTADLDQQVAAYYVDNRIRITADVLEAIADHMSRLPGRKNLIWLAGRFPFSFDPLSHFSSGELSVSTREQMARTARALTDANVAIYPISAVGLLAPEFNQPTAPANAGLATRRRVRFQQRVADSGSRLEQEPDGTNTMRHIAETTGGEAFYLTNGIAVAMQSAIDDTEIVYTLGFSPGPGALDSDFHKLKVEVARDHVEVRHRRGYYGFGDPADREAGAEGPIEDLVVSPIDATRLGLLATRQPIYGGKGAYATRLLLDLNDLNMTFEEGVRTGTVEIATLLVDGSDDNPDMRAGMLTIRLSNDEFLESAEVGGYELMRFRNGTGPPGWLRVVVREPSSGSAGSLWVRLE